MKTHPHTKVRDSGVKEAGWAREGQEPLAYRLLTETGEAAPTRGALTQFMRAALGSLSTHEDAWPFQEAVGADEVPDYYDIIKVGLLCAQPRKVQSRIAVVLELIAGYAICDVITACNRRG